MQAQILRERTENRENDCGIAVSSVEVLSVGNLPDAQSILQFNGG
jgi:hypothetical protein